MDKNHLALVGKVDELAKAVEVAKAAQSAADRTASVTPLKGGTFESEVNAVMENIATGLGDEYAQTGGVAGTIQRCFKGDGVLTAGSGQARVVVEMHDSTDARVWSEYLEIAERNGQALASIGIVRNAEQNKGQTIRVLGSRRVIVAFDPMANDIDLLRTVVQLVRTAALAASARRDVEELETAEEASRCSLPSRRDQQDPEGLELGAQALTPSTRSATQFRQASRVTWAWRSMRWPECRSRLLNRTPTGCASGCPRRCLTAPVRPRFLGGTAGPSPLAGPPAGPAQPWRGVTRLASRRPDGAEWARYSPSIWNSSACRTRPMM